jgi:hypothetical protein
MDPKILSVSITDKNATSLAIAFSPEYKRKYMNSAAKIREKLAFVNTLIVGVEEESEALYGRTEYVVRAHKETLRVLVPSPSRTIFVSFLAKRDADIDNLAKKIAPLIAKM